MAERESERERERETEWRDLNWRRVTVALFLFLRGHPPELSKIIKLKSVKSLFLKDSCDGSGLNTNEKSKDSHPSESLKGCLSDIFQISYTVSVRPSVRWLVCQLVCQSCFRFSAFYETQSLSMHLFSV